MRGQDGVQGRGGGKQRNPQEKPGKGYGRWIFFSILTFLSWQWGLEGGVASAGILWSPRNWAGLGAKSFVG